MSTFYINITLNVNYFHYISSLIAVVDLKQGMYGHKPFSRMGVDPLKARGFFN